MGCCRTGKNGHAGYYLSGETLFRSNLISVSNRQVDFFFKMRDTLTCITSSRLEPVYFRKGAEEGDRYTVDEVWFSYKTGNVLPISVV